MTITRWTVAIKAGILDAIDHGEMSEAEAQSGYGISAEEMAEWRRRYRAGKKALGATRR